MALISVQPVLLDLPTALDQGMLPVAAAISSSQRMLGSCLCHLGCWNSDWLFTSLNSAKQLPICRQPGEGARDKPLAGSPNVLNYVSVLMEQLAKLGMLYTAARVREKPSAYESSEHIG